MTTDDTLFRLPTYLDKASGRKVRLRSSEYTVLGTHGDRVSKALGFGRLADARKCAALVAKLPGTDGALIVRPAGHLDDPDFLEEVSGANAA